MRWKKRSPACSRRGARGNDPLGKSISRENTHSSAPSQPSHSWETHDEAILAPRGVIAVSLRDPSWFEKLLEGNNPAGKLILVQQKCPDTPAWVTVCDDSSGFSVAESISFRLALQIGLEALRTGATLAIEIGGEP